MATTGSCMCGDIRYQFTGEPAVTALCHCVDCQKWTGSAFTSNAVVPRTAFSVTQGASGKINKHFFCSNCGSSLYTELEVMPDMTCVKAGGLDGGAANLGNKIGVEFYVKDRPQYLKACDGAKQEPQFGVSQVTGIPVAKPRVVASISSRFRRSVSQMTSHPYACDIDAEPIHRYRPGGYHPVSLGDQLKYGRYKILHKVGWGGYSTTWAARDQISRETEVLRLISSLASDTHAGREHIVQLLDGFSIDGPNGKHQCLVLDLLGPSIPDIIDLHYRDERLPAQVAKSIAHQVLIGVDFLAQLKIGHGDIHARNIALAMPEVESLNEQEFVDALGQPEIGPVQRTDGHAQEIHVPPYIVRPTTFKAKEVLQSLRAPVVKIIDFGESFLPHQAPTTLHTPLVLFELFTGQPPFDSIMITPASLMSQMIQFSTDELPDRWEAKWQNMKKKLSHDDEEPCTLQEWLEEVYFDPDRRCELTKQDIAKIYDLVRRLLRFEPSLRSTAKDIANDPWFR
ncbi:hypothetical protein FHL15_002074 [Xylaria flabelliformis]|uniref:non-specific serine/threonine protein kinase n=1 Tax=Xylaria flabelliformis TaxID=2512241 RepID=A0A553IAP7_9PEZI|nr:hypothetical protein FHL15_002074 [Xylaria flabelliformis]